MKVAVLGEGLTSSLLLRHQGTTILLDCSAAPSLAAAAEQQQQLLQLAVPRLDLALQAGPIDAILATSPYALLALPYLQQCLGQQPLPLHLYCTEPCYHGFQQLAMELLQVQELLLHQANQQQQQPAAQPSGQQTAPQPQHQQQLLLQQQLQLYQQLHQQQQQQLYHQQQQQQQQQLHWLAQYGAAPRPHLTATYAGGSSSSFHGTPPGLATGTPGHAAGIPPPAPPTTPYPGSPSDQPAATANISRKQQQQEEQQHEQQQQAPAVVPFFTRQQLEAVLDALQVVRLGQRLPLPGPWDLVAEARPAGSSFDCCMWLLRAGCQTIAYLSPASLDPNPSAPLHTSALAACDALLLAPGSICPDPPLPLVNPTQQLLQLAVNTAVGAAVDNCCRVVVPVMTCGALLQLLEAVADALDKRGPRGLAVPLFLLSPAGPDCLATADSCCEYLQPSKQRQLLEKEQPPFCFDALVQSGRLRLLTGTGTPQQQRDEQEQEQGSCGGRAPLEAAVQQVLAAGPCVVFVPLWSLAAGAGAMLAAACSRNPQDVLLLPEQGPLTADWMEQCNSSRSSSSSDVGGGSSLRCAGWPQADSRWRVLYCPVNSMAGAVLSQPPSEPGSSGSSGDGTAGHVVGGCLTAGQLLQLLQGLGVQRLLLGGRDRQLLDRCMQQRRAPLFRCILQTLPRPSSSHLSSVAADLPGPSPDVQLSKELSKQLMLTPLVPHGSAALAASEATGAGAAGGALVSVARLQGLLAREAGCWRLLPLPTFTKPDALAATVALQQQRGEQLSWGEVELQQLLSDLRAAGFNQLSVVAETAVAGSSSCGGVGPGQGQQPATLIKVAEGAEIRLSDGSTEVLCDSWQLRRQLLDIVTAQLIIPG